MQLRALLNPATLGVVWILGAVVTLDAQAGTENTDETEEPVVVELSGRLSAEGRWFPEAGAFAGQRSLASGFVAEPRLYLEDAGGSSLTVAPFFRYDHSDPRRTHFDLHEAYLLLFGEIGDSGWELRLGVDQVFWGVTESQHLVDIVNQVDFVEHPGGKAKLGQPMVHATWFGDWGAFELFGMPYHRARTFQGREGRLRLPFVVDDEGIQYEGGGRAVAPGPRLPIQPQLRAARSGSERIRRHQPRAVPDTGRRSGRGRRPCCSTTRRSASSGWTPR